MLHISRISHATFETPDLQKALDYFVQVNGLALVDRAGGRAFLAAKTGLLAIGLEQGETARCSALAFELGAGAEPEAVRRHLAQAGIACDERHDAAPRIANMLALRDPNGTRIELFSGISYVAAGADVVGVGPLKLGHVAFFTSDPRALSEFYQRVLGFRISDWIEDFFVFMRCNPDHHSVNFLRGEAGRMHHIAFELRDVAHIAVSCDLLAQKRIPLAWGPLRFGPGHNVAAFHRNHDNQLVEFYAELDQMKDEGLGYFDPRPWHRDRPQRPKVWTFRDDPVWGPAPPPGFM
jgi:catechol 2,3-dioxygenase-like lactoylglutathione lyase family enzyme